MDREFFSLLAMRFRGATAFEWQRKFNQAFYEMEKVIYSTRLNQQSEKWLAYREQGKIARREDLDNLRGTASTPKANKCLGE